MCSRRKTFETVSVHQLQIKEVSHDNGNALFEKNILGGIIKKINIIYGQPE